MAITIQNLTRAYLKASRITATVSTSGEELLQKDGSLHLELESMQGGIFGDDTMGETTELLRCSLTLQNNDVNEIMAMVLESYRYVVVQQAQEANQHLADMVSTTLKERKELELGHEKLVNEFRIEAFELEEERKELLARIAELEEENRQLYEELAENEADFLTLDSRPKRGGERKGAGRPIGKQGQCGLCSEPGHNRRTCPTHSRTKTFDSSGWGSMDPERDRE